MGGFTGTKFLPFVGLNFERRSSSPASCDAAGWADFPAAPDLGTVRTARAAVDPALLEEPPMLSLSEAKKNVALRQECVVCGGGLNSDTGEGYKI